MPNLIYLKYSQIYDKHFVVILYVVIVQLTQMLRIKFRILITRIRNDFHKKYKIHIGNRKSVTTI